MDYLSLREKYSGICRPRKHVIYVIYNILEQIKTVYERIFFFFINKCIYKNMFIFFKTKWNLLFRFNRCMLVSINQIMIMCSNVAVLGRLKFGKAFFFLPVKAKLTFEFFSTLHACVNFSVIVTIKFFWSIKQ